MSTWWMDCKNIKKKISRWLFEIIHIIRFEMNMDRRINLKIFLGYDINYLSIWPFMHHPWFWILFECHVSKVKALSILSWVTLNSTSEFMLLWKRCFWSPQMQLSCFQQALCGWILNNIISRCMPACCRVLYLQLKFFIGKW